VPEVFELEKVGKKPVGGHVHLVVQQGPQAKRVEQYGGVGRGRPHNGCQVAIERKLEVLLERKSQVAQQERQQHQPPVADPKARKQEEKGTDKRNLLVFGAKLRHGAGVLLARPVLILTSFS
jgi:hypothetical protein